MALKVQIIDSLLSIDEKVWDSCANSVEIQSLLGVPGKTLDPFTTYRFLRALEKSKCVRYSLFYKRLDKNHNHNPNKRKFIAYVKKI